MDDLDLSGGVWRLTGLVVDDDPVDLPEGAEVTLEVVDGQAVGRAACNRYGAALTVVGSSVRVAQARRTLMACEEPLLRLEDAYLRALTRVEAGHRDGDRLELTGPAVRLDLALA